MSQLTSHPHEPHLRKSLMCNCINNVHLGDGALLQVGQCHPGLGIGLRGVQVATTSQCCTRRSGWKHAVLQGESDHGPVRNRAYDYAQDSIHKNLHPCLVLVNCEGSLAALRLSAAAAVVHQGVHESANGELSPAGQSERTISHCTTYNRRSFIHFFFVALRKGYSNADIHRLRIQKKY